LRHLVVMEYGQFLGCSDSCLHVREGGETVLETPLSRLRTISIARKGVSFSSNLVLECSNRGIRLFILDWRGINVAAISGRHQHGVVALRQAQFSFAQSPASRNMAASILYAKLRNQRAVLLYFSKYHELHKDPLLDSSDKIANSANSIRTIPWAMHNDTWLSELVGYEGASARIYWQALKNSGLLASDFNGRVGRGATDVTNQLLNYGYTLLISYIWAALDNAGLELYLGVLHQRRPGKPSLVLDFMEEYRAWVVDRNVIKLRRLISTSNKFDTKLKKGLSESIQKTMSTKYPYKGKKLRLESIIQRQAYRLAGAMVEKGNIYKSYRFRW
jgi:CRISPR-associated protein Cas1